MTDTLARSDREAKEAAERRVVAAEARVREVEREVRERREEACAETMKRRNAEARLSEAVAERDAARAEGELLREAMARAHRWIRDVAETRERDAKPFPVIFDHACAECIPHGEIVKPGFRCAVHEARTAAPATTTTKEQSHG
jgi:hypothetical protein